MRPTAVLIALFLASQFLAACGDDDGGDGRGTAAPTGTGSQAPAPGPCLTNLDAPTPEGGLSWGAILPDEVPAPEGWSVQPAEGEGPFLTVSDGEQAVGSLELFQTPLGTLTEPPFDPQRGLVALQEWALDFYRSVREDRELTFGEEYVFEQEEPEPADAGGFCAVRYSFTGTLNDEVSDRVVGYATYDRENLYLFVASYDAANAAEAIGFVGPDKLEEYVPALGELVETLRLPAE